MILAWACPFNVLVIKTVPALKELMSNQTLFPLLNFFFRQSSFIASSLPRVLRSEVVDPLVYDLRSLLTHKR